jgi:hypothetical protein
MNHAADEAHKLNRRNRVTRQHCGPAAHPHMGDLRLVDHGPLSHQPRPGRAHRATSLQVGLGGEVFTEPVKVRRIPARWW